MSVRLQEHEYAVVAVDGSDEGHAAVSVAPAEAQRHGYAVRIAQVMPAYPIGPLGRAGGDEGLMAQILALAEHPRLVVVGRRHSAAVDRVPPALLEKTGEVDR